MEVAGAHRADLLGIGVGDEPPHRLARGLGEVRHQRLEGVAIDRGTLDREVGEYQHGGIELRLRVRGGVGDEIAVVVAVANVE